jgi:predicted dehydrogenase
MAATGRVCQVGFQALGSPALAELRSTVDGGVLGVVEAIAMRGAWFRDEAYFRRSAWVGRATVDGRPALDGALANPFAHAVMQVLALADGHGTPTVEVDRYRTREDIDVDDTAALRLAYPDGLQVLVAVSLCAEEYEPGEITVTGTKDRAVLEYTTDRLQLPGESGLSTRPGRTTLLENLVAHRASGQPLIAPLARTRPFTAVLEAVSAAPVTVIPDCYLTTRHDMDTPRLVITGVNAALHAAAQHVALLRELDLPWAVPTPDRNPVEYP